MLKQRDMDEPHQEDFSREKGIRMRKGRSVIDAGVNKYSSYAERGDGRRPSRPSKQAREWDRDKRSYKVRMLVLAAFVIPLIVVPTLVAAWFTGHWDVPATGAQRHAMILEFIGIICAVAAWGILSYLGINRHNLLGPSRKIGHDDDPQQSGPVIVPKTGSQPFDELGGPGGSN